MHDDGTVGGLGAAARRSGGEGEVKTNGELEVDLDGSTLELGVEGGVVRAESCE